ncbi:2-oxoacid:acceptor oxidoreductase family protein [Thiobacter aerophilum]|uniref:2-oxoacid:acceptor oxidoreductase family protein n=1 Tax=Thiobacter aerophilum TaxID=3121275 RepID=A0ABV0ECA1_9BURK
MIELRIHGRGGQGNVVAAYLIATAAILEGWHAQAFPAFGAERRGAPVTAFVRIARDPFRRRNQIVHPDFLIIQDPALLHVPGVLDGLKSTGAVVLDGNRVPEGVEAVALPATRLAKAYLGRPVPNTALAAAFFSLTGFLPLSALRHALAARFKGPVLEKNLRLIEAAAAQVEAGRWRERVHAAAA